MWDVLRREAAFILSCLGHAQWLKYLAARVCERDAAGAAERGSGGLIYWTLLTATTLDTRVKSQEQNNSSYKTPSGCERKKDN